MNTLSHFLLNENQRDTVVQDCVSLIERQINAGGLMRRTALKAGVAVLEKIKPNALHRGVNGLLPEFAAELEPLYVRFRGDKSRDFSAFIIENTDLATGALIGVADKQADNSKNSGVRAAYKRLRPIAEGEVRSSIPEIARIIGARVPPKE